MNDTINKIKEMAIEEEYLIRFTLQRAKFYSGLCAKIRKYLLEGRIDMALDFLEIIEQVTLEDIESCNETID